MTTADIHALTGAYALDAVSGDERVEFERHLAECESCAQEVRELRETATRLGLAAAATPPPELRDRVLDRIGAVRQLAPDTTVTPLRRRPLALRLTAAAAAVLFVAAVALGAIVLQQNQRLDENQAYTARMEQLLTADDAQLMRFDVGDHGQVSVAVSRSRDELMMLSDGLTNPPPGKTFQVWTMVDDTDAHSIGFLQPDEGYAALAAAGLGDANQVAVSLEPAGGSPQPTTPAIGSAEMPTA